MFVWLHGQGRARRQGLRHGLELFHKLLVTPVGVGQSFAVQVHQLAEPFDLGLECEVLCPGFVSDMLTDFRKVTIGVTSGDLSDVFDFVIHEDPVIFELLRYELLVRNSSTEQRPHPHSGCAASIKEIGQAEPFPMEFQEGKNNEA